MEGDLLKMVGADVLGILSPVSLCMFLVVLLVRAIGYSPNESDVTVFANSPDISSTEKFEGALLNAMFVVVAITVVTFLIFVLYYYRFMRLLKGYMYVSILFVLFYTWGYILVSIVQTFSIPVDIISFGLFLFNFTVLGMLSIFSNWTPIVVNQFYKVMLGVSSAFWYSRLEEWNTWALLVALVFYDLVAVLAPGGPLKLLVELASRRGEEIPGLVYNARPSVRLLTGSVPQQSRDGGENDCQGENSQTHFSQSLELCSQEASASLTSAWSNAGNVSYGGISRRIPGVDYFESGGQTPNSRDFMEESSPLISETVRNDVVRNYDSSSTRGSEEEDDQAYSSSGGIKLGLGDFIFYSVLVGRAAMYDLMTVYACYLAIISGLGCTLALLGVCKHALPALPISIMFGILFYFLSRFLMEPFVVGLSSNFVMF